MLADLVTREVGKRRSEADDEVTFATSFMRYNAEWDRRLDGELLPGDVAGEHIDLRRQPLGVIAAICPWNFPLAVLCRKLGPALVTGNTVVVTVMSNLGFHHAMRREGIQAPHSCLVGSCASCMCTLVDGTVDLLNNDALDQQELNEGWTLACQAVATSDRVHLRFPD